VVHRLEGRLSDKQLKRSSETSPGELAVHLLNQKLTEATDDVLDTLTLEQLVEKVNRETGVSTQMYYI